MGPVWIQTRDCFKLLKKNSRDSHYVSPRYGMGGHGQVIWMGGKSAEAIESSSTLLYWMVPIQHKGYCCTFDSRVLEGDLIKWIWEKLHARWMLKLFWSGTKGALSCVLKKVWVPFSHSFKSLPPNLSFLTSPSGSGQHLCQGSK